MSSTTSPALSSQTTNLIKPHPCSNDLPYSSLSAGPSPVVCFQPWVIQATNWAPIICQALKTLRWEQVMIPAFVGPCCTWDLTDSLPPTCTHTLKDKLKFSYQGIIRIKSKANFRISRQDSLRWWHLGWDLKEEKMQWVIHSGQNLSFSCWPFFSPFLCLLCTPCRLNHHQYSHPLYLGVFPP